MGFWATIFSANTAAGSFLKGRVTGLRLAAGTKPQRSVVVPHQHIVDRKTAGSQPTDFVTRDEMNAAIARAMATIPARLRDPRVR